MGRILVPEHYEYCCDFFCNAEATETPKTTPIEKLRGLKLTCKDNKCYAILVNPMNDNAEMLICEDCHGNLAALWRQIQVEKRDKLGDAEVFPELAEKVWSNA